MPCSWVASASPPVPVGVQRGRLVRVLAVAEHRAPLVRRPGERRPAGAVGGVGQLVPHPVGHRHVVRRGVGEGGRCQALPLGQREAAPGDRAQHVAVHLRGRHDGDRGVVLRGGTHHRRAADVDLLDALVGGGAGRDGLGERVQVRDDQVERLHPELGELADVGLQAPVGQDARVHPGMQRLDPAVEALGETGELLDPRDRQAEALDQRGRAAGGDQGDPGVVQAADEVLQTALVVDGDQGPSDLDAGVARVSHGRTGPSCR